jgi:hypothetical protein
MFNACIFKQLLIDWYKLIKLLSIQKHTKLVIMIGPRSACSLGPEAPGFHFADLARYQPYNTLDILITILVGLSLTHFTFAPHY